MEQPSLAYPPGGIASTWFFIFQSSPLWCSLACFAAMLFGWYYSSTYGCFKRMGLRGPRPLPVMGNAIGNIMKAFAYVDLDNVKNYGKVHGTFDGQEPNLMVADPDMVKDILVKEFSAFVNRPPFVSRVIFAQPALSRGIFSTHDDHWKHVRAMLSPTYTSGKLKQMLPTIKECTNVLVSYLDRCGGNEVDVREILSAYTLDVIAGTAFGLDVKSLDSTGSPARQHLNHLIGVGTMRHRAMAVAAGLVSPRLLPLLRKLGISVFDKPGIDYFESVVSKVLASKGDEQERQNFITLCRGDHVSIDQVDQSSVRCTADGSLWTTKGLTSEDIVSNALLFLLGGFDTVSAFLTTFCYAMATNPQAQQRVYEELVEHATPADLTYESLKDLTYLDMCMDEALRMYPPLFRLVRHCNKDVDIGSIHVPRGLSVSILVYALHYDPVHWPEPDTFRPERFLPEEKSKRHPYAYLPFGTGPRNCIGMRLALLAAKAAIVKIIAKYDICPCEATPSPPLELGPGMMNLVPKKPIILRFVQRTSPE